MTSRLLQFCADIAAAFRRLFSPKSVRAPRPILKPEQKTLILAWSAEEAQDYAHLNRLTNWAAPREAEHLYGYRDVRIVRLPGWMHKLGRDDRFMQALQRLETVAWVESLK